MNKTIQLIIVAVILALPVSVKGQDARFSQYFNNPLTLNPALAGNGIEYIRVTGIYRNQWAGMGNPFTTQGFAVDKVVNRVGLGAGITRNGAGDEGIRTLSISGNLAYHLPLGKDKINTLSAGLQIGIVNKSFDQSKLSFDNQYNPDAGYDPNMGSNEIFTSTSVTRPDVNIGLFWQRGWQHKEVRFKPFLGFSMSHVNRPDETFIVENNKAPIKKTLYGGGGYLITEQLEVRPSVMLLRQDQFKETTFGSLISYQLDNKNTVQLGAYHRMNDAVIAYAGYQMNLLFVGMSYDVNTSELSKSGKGTNAFELSLTYSPRPKKKKEPKPVAPKIERPVPGEKMELKHIENNEIQIPETLAFVPAENSIAEGIENNAPPMTPPAVAEIPAPAAEIIAETPVVKDFDQDGIADADDDCPYINGNKMMKGCPDSDNDGIIDMKDDCPMESGPATNKGC
ncbi:MAG TPA: type IX secretion system membrane protein PorP/SprF, partial [Bacteroidia bacterium]|nr:type IX secretion system membrane protein PorP/SprF [Bacteroidia bacterium]